MDNKTFNSNLAKHLGRSSEDTAMLTDGLAKILIEAGSDLDSVAVPGFGTFTAVKEDEKIIIDEQSGRRTLIPPCISMRFQPSVVLRKKFSR